LKKFRISFFAILIFFVGTHIFPQENNFEQLSSNLRDTFLTQTKFYCGLIHQHHDFYHKAFSYQGIELGTLINDKILMGIYGYTFASVLEVKSSNSPVFLQMWQAGLIGGWNTYSSGIFHTGLLLNIGYFSIVSDSTEYSLFKPNKSKNEIKSFIVIPQIYAQIDITKWLKGRFGIAYDFYTFKDNATINKSDLQNISINFGILFGKF
jgi:hypothetical protein